MAIYFRSILLFQLISLSLCWMQEPYGNNEFNHKQEYGKNVTLFCHDDNTPDEAVFQYWIRPDLTVMKEDQFDEFWTLDGYSTWQVSSDGSELYATLLNSKQFGFYYCVLEYNNETFVVKQGINYNGPYFGDLWPKYRSNVITGGAAAAVFVGLVIIFAIIVKCCCKGNGGDKQEGSEIGNSYVVTNDVRMQTTHSVPDYHPGKYVPYDEARF